MVLDRANRTIWIFKKRKKTNKKDLRTVLCKKRGEETKGETIGAEDNLRQHPNRVLPATITIVGRKISRHSIEPIIIQSGSLNRNYYLGGDERLWRRSFREVPAPLHTDTRGRGKCTLPTSESAGAGQRSMEKHHRYNEGERKMAGDAGRRGGKHQESVTLRANEKIKRHSTGRGGGGGERYTLTSYDLEEKEYGRVWSF